MGGKKNAQISFLDEIIVDNFAGGGGASTGMELATGRPVAIAINHDPEAIKMHMATFPNGAEIKSAQCTTFPKERRCEKEPKQ